MTQELFKKHITKNLNFLTKNKVIIAISGGIDSVVLTHLCHKIGLNVALAHCNFNLRGNESDADETFVETLAESLGLEVFIQNFDTSLYAKEHKRSIQMAARELRYNWFDELSSQLKFDYILTAHHADDNLETFLINFTRGTGIEGLTGIPEINGKFVRPLLPFSSDDIELYANANSIKWRDDSSNKSVKYLRNKLRHEVIPILKEINPSLLQSFQSTLNNLQDSSTIINDKIDEFLNKTIERISDNEVRFKISEFKKAKHPKAYLFEALKEFGFTEWDDIVSLLDAQPGKQVFSNEFRLIKDRDYLLLTKKEVEQFSEIIISSITDKVETPFGTLSFAEIDAVETNIKTAKNSICVDKNTLEFPLTIRKKEEGDVFFPIGMQGKKKLSKYFKDEKFSLLDKENTLLLCSKNQIVWIVNNRADDRFKVTKTTKQILKIELK
ncbi:tRNA lysidine(34) synthetase TilS [Neotamlana laminarinivorans]|uniref:tRNA(Ile)-lysidine synthase n=1 Tax=Neotamlana laminarinivorans TaxID=2883124 RepID=A0A9X1L0C0_9FLAO|nr:tRNA lysidine(34) synthetase TilS [Tamlana laminarinivorans]MCB4797295.1 tRNA lysidine(34) synthetase TilS [Tamlana laminarinivorans]